MTCVDFEKNMLRVKVSLKFIVTPKNYLSYSQMYINTILELRILLVCPTVHGTIIL